jgi:hypothetical protein
MTEKFEINNSSPENWIFVPGEGYKYVGDVKHYTQIEDPKDSIVMSLIKEHIERAKKGRIKYNTNLDRIDLNIIDYLQHAKEEAMDLALYLEKAIKMLKEYEQNTEDNQGNKK